jgi:serine phosphatase RsbU (regulator of sigma subunit)
MIDPVRFRKAIVTLFKIIILFELVSALMDGLLHQQWGRFGNDLLIAGILYIMWGRIKRTVQQKKEEYRRKVESSTESLRIWDAFAFSVLWSDQIFSNIPADRKRLVVISFTLIAIGLIASVLEIGSGLMPLVIVGTLVLGGVNLLVWVVSLEREEKESLQTEMKLAHDVQVALMPTHQPTVEGFDIAGMSLPAREVGGDHFDYAYLCDGGSTFGISVFDVSGKGMQAAMSAVFTSGAYASEVHHSTSPAAILTRLNRSVYTHSKRGHFVAFLCVAIDPATRILTFANAGQTKPLLLSGAQSRWLSSPGVHFPLGMKEDSMYEDHQVQLHHGDLLVLVTDGFTEAMSASKEQYGAERMEQTVRALAEGDFTAQRVIDHVSASVQAHVADAPQHDDMTMVVVKVQ